MKKLAILGSTGNIGKQTIDVVNQHPDEYEIKAVAAYNEVEEVLAQVEKFNLEAVSLAIPQAAKELETKLQGKGVEVFSGEEGLGKIATWNSADTIVVSVVGNVGIKATYEAIKAGKNIALANKETLVSGGYPIMQAVKENNTNLMPIDSEHSAIFQCLNGENHSEISKIIVTCSGGSFRGKKLADLVGMTKEQALNHPTWNMGGKITIDSATLMNKGFEVIEAHWLYDVPYENIEVVVHPQSLIHSAVEFVDGSIIAQVGNHDMRMPIQYALSYPKRFPNNIPKFSFLAAKQFTFEEPDLETFACLKYAMDAGKREDTVCAAMNSANDAAVFAFLAGKISFLDIQNTVKKVIDWHEPNAIAKPKLEDVLRVATEAKDKANEMLGISDVGYQK